MESSPHLSNFSLRLIETLSKESGLQGLVDLGYEFLGNPFTITDCSLKLLSSSGATKVTDDLVWNELHTKKNLTFETYSYYKRSSLFSEIAKNEAPFYWSDSYTKYPRLIGKICINNRDVAIMVACAHNRNFKEKDKALVSLLCDVFSIEFQKNKYSTLSQGLMHQSFIYDLLDGKFEGKQLIVERTKILNLKFKTKLFVINIDIQNLDQSKSTLPYIRDEIQSKFVSGKPIVYNNNVVILASCDNERHFLENELKTLKEFINRNNLKIGISRPFSNLADAKGHYFESVKAIKLGKILNTSQHFYKYEDFIIFDLISNISDTGKCKRFIHRSLLRLIDFDKENGTDYARSFYTYVCNFKNIKDSATLLDIHRNTMFHRIGKIESILDVDVLFQLYLSYKIMEFYKIDF